MLPPAEDFTAAIIPTNSERLRTARELSLEDYSETISATERAQELLNLWSGLYRQPFKGITSDGRVEPGLFKLTDEGFRSAPAVAAARALLSGLTDKQRERVQHDIDAPEWRGWYNPEWLVNRNGLRLDTVSGATHEHVLQLLKACLSKKGYIKINRARSANAYLGELYDLPHIMNEWSYHFLLFGKPSEVEPWGWSLYGHHLALNVLIIGRQIVISPTFIGTEPTYIRRRNGESFHLLGEEAESGLALIHSLSPKLRRRAVIYKHMKDPAMPEGRWQFADERHLGGAFQDNRIVPYEGVRGDALDAEQRRLLMEIVQHFLCYLPDGPRAARLAQIERHLDDTWWSWIGGYGDEDPFYYRVQSPVVMLEFDHHSGVWLTNSEPAKYHIHTIARTPNGGDYGKQLLRQYYEQKTAGPYTYNQGGDD